MPKKIVEDTMLSGGDLIKFDSPDGVVVYEVLTVRKSLNLGTQVFVETHTGKTNFYQTELIARGAEVIMVLDLIKLFAEYQKEYEKYRQIAVDVERKNDLSGGKFS